MPYSLLNIGWFQMKHRCTYVHLKNLFLVDVVTLLYKYEVRLHGNYTGIYTNKHLNRLENT